MRYVNTILGLRHLISKNGQTCKNLYFGMVSILYSSKFQFHTTGSRVGELTILLSHMKLGFLLVIALF